MTNGVENLRLYFWFRGVDPNRVGGPWWYRDFMREEDRNRFLDDIGGQLFKYALCDNQATPFKLVENGEMIVPPEGVKIIEVKPCGA